MLVRELIVGDKIGILDGKRWGIFLGRSAHPVYPGLCAVTWVLDNGYSIDALSPNQDVGELMEKIPITIVLTML